MTRAWIAMALVGCGRIGFDVHDGTGVVTSPANLVFVTSTTQVPGAFGGVDGGDAVCAARERGAPRRDLRRVALLEHGQRTRSAGTGPDTFGNTSMTCDNTLLPVYCLED